MSQNSLQPTEKTPVQAATGKTSRLFFIDHLRAALVILVVLHHIALVYGGIPPFYYLEPPNPTNDLLAGLVLFAFVLFNQAWFMGAFFLLILGLIMERFAQKLSMPERHKCSFTNAKINNSGLFYSGII
jgi:hypothetical protein